MRLWIKQKVFSWGDRFTVKDDAGNDRYTVQGEVFSWGKKLHVYDSNGNEAAFIQQKVFSFLPRFFVFQNGVQVAEIVKEFTFFKPVYTILGPGWETEGDFLSHDYRIDRNGETLVTICKEWFTWGDSYLLDVRNPEDEVLALAVVLAIDCVIQSQSNSGSQGAFP
jgi:uncharacterized protein YxjI